jgi:hypothetical protein
MADRTPPAAQKQRVTGRRVVLEASIHVENPWGRSLHPAAHGPRGAGRNLIEHRRFVRTPMALGIATASHFGRPQSLHIRRSGPGGMIWKKSSRSATANQSSEN